MEFEKAISLDLEVEIVQLSKYLEIAKKLLLKYRHISIIKLYLFCFYIKKQEGLRINIYTAKNSEDLVLKFLSQISGRFDELCEQLPYYIKSLDILILNNICSLHDGELFCSLPDDACDDTFDQFTHSVIEESKQYSDRQFLKEVISIV